MIPGKVDAVTCGQTINLRLPYGLLVSIGIEDGLKVQEGQNAMIKRETTDTIPLLHIGTTITQHSRLNFKKQVNKLMAVVPVAYTPDSTLVH